MSDGATTPQTGRWRSLRRQLPLTLSIVTTAILGVIVFAAFNEVESALIASSRNRARAAASQAASILAGSLRGSVTTFRNAADSPMLRAYLKTRTPESLSRAREALHTTLVSPVNWRVASVVDTGGVVLAEMPVAPSGGGAMPKAFPPINKTGLPGLQPLRSVDDGAFLEFMTPVLDDDAARTPLGQLVIQSSFAVTPPGLFSRLVGDNASVLLGNAFGGLWLDLATSRRVPPPTDGGDTVGAEAPMDDLPLQVRTEFPREAIVAPAWRLLQRLALLGLVIAVAGAVIVRVVTLRATDPLVTEDIARQVEAARVLRDNEERLRYTLSAARVGTWEMDRYSGQMRWSATMGPLFGIEPKDLPATRERLIDLIHPDDRGEVTASLLRKIDDRAEHEIQFRALQPDGSYKWINGRSRLTDTGGSLQLVGACIDITEQKQLEEQLRQAAKMDAIGKLAGGIAHDFNNMLTAILGFGEFLLEDLPPGDPRRPQVEEIMKAGRRAAELTSQLLAFSRRQLLQPKIVDVNSAVTDIIVMLRRLIGENIRLTANLAPDAAMVRADPVQLQQILMNLCINARDAMPQGGELTIDIANVDFDDTYSVQNFKVEPGSYVMIAVTDTGVGMTEEVRVRLFEPFFTTKRRGEGTGLGLATVYGAIKQAGGYVWAHGEPGKGSAFKVYLPRIDGYAADEPALAGAASGAGSETILLVEDEDAVRLLTCTILARAGYRVIEAADASEAMAKFAGAADSIALLLTDVVLPGSSGSELYRELFPRNPRLKVVYMSGYTDDSVFRTGGLEPGAVFIQKPFSAEMLKQKIREAIDSIS